MIWYRLGVWKLKGGGEKVVPLVRRPGNCQFKL